MTTLDEMMARRFDEAMKVVLERIERDLGGLNLPEPERPREKRFPLAPPTEIRREGPV